MAARNENLQCHPATRSLLHFLSAMQQNIIHTHTFGTRRRQYGRGWQLLPAADRRAAASTLKVTAPTRIAAANIRRSSIFSLLSLFGQEEINKRVKVGIGTVSRKKDLEPWQQHTQRQ
jgi:hypothetical protein